jgi:hypothetical protein
LTDLEHPGIPESTFAVSDTSARLKMPFADENLCESLFAFPDFVHSKNKGKSLVEAVAPLPARPRTGDEFDW